jgi:exodeoxyribonuclease VII large subunit
MNRGVKEKLKTNNSNLEKLYKNIKILNPLSILDRGYAIVTNDKGVALKSSKQVNNGEKLQARLSEGSIEVKVNKVND